MRYLPKQVSFEDYRKKFHQRKAEIFAWSLLLLLVVIAAYAGSNPEPADTANTSSTRAVTVTAVINPGIEIYIDDTEINFTVIAGADDYDSNEVIVKTSSLDGYKLYAGQTEQLEHTTDAGTRIEEASMGGEDAPYPYTASTTGLAFSLSGTPAESLWNAAAGSISCNYSSFTSGSGVEVNNYASYSESNTTVTVFYRLDVTAPQKSGTYQNNVVWYAVSND